MNKPDGITKEAWDAARHALSNAFTETIPNPDMAIRVARAIQSAVEEERANAAKVADYALDQYGRLSFVQTEGWIGLRKVVAERIRKGA